VTKELEELPFPTIPNKSYALKNKTMPARQFHHHHKNLNAKNPTNHTKRSDNM